MEQNAADKALDELSPRELELFKSVEANGARPVSVTLANQMFQLYLNGYSCEEIARQNKGYTEGDVIFCRVRYRWDAEKVRYAIELNRRAAEALQKSKLEAIEFLTNQLTITHKEQREQMIKYLQTGEEKDKPKSWISGTATYKSVIEILQKITGEDKINRHEIKQETTIKVEEGAKPILVPSPIQNKWLEQMAKSTNKK